MTRRRNILIPGWEEEEEEGEAEEEEEQHSDSWIGIGGGGGGGGTFCLLNGRRGTRGGRSNNRLLG